VKGESAQTWPLGLYETNERDHRDETRQNGPPVLHAQTGPESDRRAANPGARPWGRRRSRRRHAGQAASQEQGNKKGFFWRAQVPDMVMVTDEADAGTLSVLVLRGDLLASWWLDMEGKRGEGDAGATLYSAAPDTVACRVQYPTFRCCKTQGGRVSRLNPKKRTS
jgi:hypothetical protein